MTVSSCLGRGFVPVDEPILSGEVLQFGQLWAESMIALIALVGQQHSGDCPPVAEGDLTGGKKKKQNRKN